MFSCLLIAPPGAGKTTAASTAPSPILYIDADNKLHKMINMKDKLANGQVIQWAVNEPLSAMTMSQIAAADPKPGAKFAQKRPKGYTQIASMIDKLVEGKCVIEHQGKKIQIKTVVIDSYTSINEHLKRLLIAVNGQTTMNLALWGTVLTNFETLNNTVLRLPCNVIFTSHEKVDKDELTGRISYRPLIDGQMKDKIGKDFEEVYYLEKSLVGGVAKYEMLTIGNTMKQCRTSRILNPKVTPDFSKIYKED